MEPNAGHIPAAPSGPLEHKPPIRPGGQVRDHTPSPRSESPSLDGAGNEFGEREVSPASLQAAENSRLAGRRLGLLARDAGYAASVAFVYFVTARLSLLLAFEHTNASPVWPPAGIALAAAWILGYRVVPGIMVGAFFANLLSVMGDLGADVRTATGSR